MLGKTQEPLTLEWVDRQRRSFEEERAAVQRAIETTERDVFTAGAKDSLTLKAQNATYAEVQRLQLELGKAQQQLDALALSTADFTAFIRGLEQKLQALNDADIRRKARWRIQFLYCPACYAPIDKNENPMLATSPKLL